MFKMLIKRKITAFTNKTICTVISVFSDNTNILSILKKKSSWPRVISLIKKNYVIYLFIKKKEKCFISLVIIGKHIIFSVVFLGVFFSLNQWHSIEIVRDITWPKIKKKEVIWLQNLFNYIRLSRQGSNWQIRYFK